MMIRALTAVVKFAACPDLDCFLILIFSDQKLLLRAGAALYVSSAENTSSIFEDTSRWLHLLPRVS